MKRSDLADLAAFARVARLRSFRRAAVDMNLSPSALSHAVRQLEERLGVRLLHRTTRSVLPSELKAFIEFTRQARATDPWGSGLPQPLQAGLTGPVPP